jgi:hypothetical protein
MLTELRAGFSAICRELMRERSRVTTCLVSPLER